VCFFYVNCGNCTYYCTVPVPYVPVYYTDTFPWVHQRQTYVRTGTDTSHHIYILFYYNNNKICKKKKNGNVLIPTGDRVSG